MAVDPRKLDPSKFEWTTVAANTEEAKTELADERQYEDPGVMLSPTRESIDKALRIAQSAVIPGLQDSPILKHIEWEEEPTAAAPSGPPRLSELDPSKFDWVTPVQETVVEEDDYGWGIANAFKRGAIRLGQLVDIAQGDVEEYTEGAEALKKYGVSEEDQLRLEKLQESDGFWEALGYYITNPALAMQVVAESLPMSLAPLVGGAAGSVAGTMAGGPVGTVIGGAAGAGLGSFGTEYLASIDEAMQEYGVDTTDADDVKAFFADEEAMADARAIGAKRGIGVAAFDALSMGVAGRIYKPVKSLTGAATKSGAVLGGTSEILAQSTAGALGELSAQKIAGQEYDPAAVAGEFIGEIVPGVGEIAINKMVGRDAAGNKIEDDTTTPSDGTTPPTTPPPDGTTPTDETTTVGKTVEDEAEDMVVPPSEEAQATTSDTSPDEKTPETQKGAIPTEEEVEQKLKAAAEKEEATDKAEAEAKEQEAEPQEKPKSPLITLKNLAPKVTKTFPKGKQSKPVRDAWRSLMQSLSERYADSELPVPQGAFSGMGVARFFKKLQEDVDITKDLPEVNDLLTQIAEQEEVADVINVVNRLAAKVRDEAPSLGATTPGSVASQVQAKFNEFAPWLAKVRGVSKAKGREGQATLKGAGKVDFATRLGEFAGLVRTLVEEADKAGVIDFEGSGLDVNYGATLDAAARAMDMAMAPTEKKTKLKSGEVGKTKTIEEFSAPGLIGIADDVVAIAENLVPKLAEVETKAAEAKAKLKEKVKKEQTKSEAVEKPTETKDLEASTNDIKLNKQSVNKPKKESKKNKDLEKGKKSDVIKTDTTEEQKGPWTEPVLQKDPAEWDYKDAVKAAKALGLPYVGKTKKEIIDRVNRSVDAELAAVELKREPKKETAKQKAVETSKKKSAKKGPTINQLRTQAKELGVSAAGSKVAIAERIADAEKRARAEERMLAEADDNADKVYSGDDYVPQSDIVAAEESIANNLNSLVEDANKVEELGGIESYEGGREAYNLAGKITSGQLTKADMKNLSMAQLRAIAKAVAAKPAPSKNVTVDRIFAAADKEVTRVEAELAQMERIDDAEKRARAEERMLAEADDNADKVFSGDDYVPQSDIHPNQSTADWVRSFVNVGGKRSVTKGTKAAIETNLKILEDNNHPEAALLRKQIEKTDIKEWGGGKKKLEAGAEVQLRSDLGNIRVVAIATKKGKVVDKDAGAPFVSFHKTMEEAMQEVEALRGELKGELIVDVREVDQPSLAVDDLQQVISQGESVNENIVKLFNLISQVNNWTGEKAAKAKLNLAHHVRNVSEALVTLSKAQRESVLEVFGVEPSATIRDTISDLNAAAYELIKADRANKKLKKEAPPADVLDPSQPMVGSAKKKAMREVGLPEDAPIEQLYEKLGVSKAAADKIRGLMGMANEEQKRALTDAAYEFASKKSVTRFVAQIEKIFGRTPSPAVLEAYTEFVLTINESQEQRMEREAAEREAAEQSDMEVLLENLTEDEIEAMKLTGNLPIDFDPEESVVDEWGVPLSKRLEDAKEGTTKQQQLKDKNDQRVLPKALAKIRDKLLSVTHSLNMNRAHIKPDKINMQEMVQLLIKALPRNHRFTHLLKRLSTLNLTMVNVELHDSIFGIDEYGRAKGIFRLGVDENEIINPMNGTTIKALYTGETTDDARFLRTLLHEMVHAATSIAYQTNKSFARKINQLWFEALENYRSIDPTFPVEAIQAVVRKDGPKAAHFMVKKHLLKTEGVHDVYYGLTDPLEFIAEAFTNEEFQKFLGNIELPTSYIPSKQSQFTGIKKVTAFKKFLNAISNYLGISTRNNVLEEVIDLSSSFFSNEMYYKRATRWAQKQKIKAVSHFHATEEENIDKKVKTSLVNDTAEAARQTDNLLKQTYERVWQRVKDLPQTINLGFMSRDQIERKYRDLFQWATDVTHAGINHLTVYIKAKQSASVLAEEYAQKAYKALTKAQKLDNKTRNKLFRMMRNTTIAQVWPHVSLKDKLNDHLWSKPDKNGVRKLSPTLGQLAKESRQAWLDLKDESPEAAALLIEMAELTKEIQVKKRIEALRAVGKVYGVDTNMLDKLAQLETQKDINKLFPQMYDDDGKLLDMQGFPAEYVIDKKDNNETKAKKKEQKKEWQDNRAMARAAEKIVENTSIKGPYFPLRRYGNYVVASTSKYNEDNQPYVSFHSTKAEADRVAAALKEKFDMGTKVTRKIQSNVVSADTESVVAELSFRMGKRTEDGVSDHMSKRLETAMYEVLADNVAYASQLKRESIDGVAADDMGRAFEEYVYVAKYTLGDLTTAHEVHEALKGLKKLQSDYTDEISAADPSGKKAETIGRVVEELAAQNRVDATDREMSSLQKAVGVLGFFNFLGAPSYWVLNATQTLTVTLPYLGSKWKGGTAAYTDAAGTIFKALKGANSYEQFKKNLPPAAQLVVKRLEEEGIIQSTIAHEFGDMISQSTMSKMIEKAGVVGRAATTGLRIMEKVPEAVEKYNRISTALAIYKLSDGDMVAVADGVQATQFNYDSANRARLLKSAPEWAGTGLRPIITPIMMFKTYGIGITRLLYGSMADVVLKKEGKAEALKLAGGLIASHTVFGGVAGGMMIAPVQAIIWAFNQAFREAGDEFDPEEAIELFLQENANDMVAALAARGVPAAMGLEMSKSINLGNLIWMGNDRINLSDAGGVETGLATLAGPVAQYGITTVREGMRLFSGDPRGNWYDFAAAAVPLKMMRGLIRGAKYEFYGVGTDTLTWTEPEDVTGWLRMTLGFRPTGIAQTMDYEYNQLARENRRSRRKSTLIDRALRAETSKERAEVWDEIESFNRSLDKRADWIRRGDVVRLRSRRRSRQRQHDRERR